MTQEEWNEKAKRALTNNQYNYLMWMASINNLKTNALGG